jgi:hypothetical protein
MDDHQRLVKAIDVQPPLVVCVMLEQTALVVF